MRQLHEGTVLDDPLAPYLDVDRPPTDDRPWVLANMVCGIDGSTAVGGRVGPLSSATDRQLFVDLRSVADVVLVGAGTARREGYGPIRLSTTRRLRRAADGRPPVPRMAIVSRSLELGDAAGALGASKGGDRALVVTCEASPRATRDQLDATADILVAGTDRVEIASALRDMRRSGVDIVLCEGGPTLLGELLAAGAVDELCLTLTPVVGGDPLPVAVLPAGSGISRGRLAHVLEADGDLFLRYLLR